MKKRFAHKNNILLVNITRLGDMLQATPTIAGLKMENPQSKITVLVEKQFSEICKHIPGIDEVVSLDLSMVVRALSREQDGIVDAFEYVGNAVDDLKSRNFDYCLNMSSSAYTALLLNMVGIKRNGGWTADDEGYRRIESDWAKLFATSVFHTNRQFNSLNLVDVFRCSADVHDHPKSLQIELQKDALEYAENFIKEAQFTNTGPIIAVQAGASQQKRQWLPQQFVLFIKDLIARTNARIILTGTEKELSIIKPIIDGVNNKNCVVAAGKTTIPQLAALLSLCNLTVTGDTGTMHISVAAKTPVVAMFLASAYGFETGPYSEGNIVLQPVIGCGPCNPNKPCARPDCHEHISPQVLSKIVALRCESDIHELPDDLVNADKVIAYRSYFDEQGFCNLKPMSKFYKDSADPYREAYRDLWLEDLGGFTPRVKSIPTKESILSVKDELSSGIEEVVKRAREGKYLIGKLIELVKDTKSPGKALTEVNEQLTELDRSIENLGYLQAPLCPITKMFGFAKENIIGTDAISLASQMGEIYGDLERRSQKFGAYYKSFT